ncbi:MAG: hypothetical protein HFI34_11150 [Lachnospiraceae bacterium]|nr:hypothetical protein [Lachnospiraceae bacterium]
MVNNSYGNTEDIRKRIRHLAESYTPEWKFDEKNPDMGSVIAMIYTDQTEDNMKRFRQVMDKYRTELINMLGISLMAARPAKSAVVMNLLGDTVEGRVVPKGTRLLEEENSVVFETLHDICVTGAKLTHIFQISQHQGKVISCSPGGPVSVFSFSGSEPVRNRLIIYHKTLFAVDNDEILLRFSSLHEQEKMNIRFDDEKKYRFYCYTQHGLEAFDETLWDEGIIRLRTKEKCVPVKMDGRQYTAIVLEALQPVLSPVELKNIEISLSGSREIPEFVCNSFMDMSCDKFTPFGEELALYAECYIGNDRIFSKAEALITLTFRFEMEENRVGFIPVRREESLKIIKRKPEKISYDREAEAFIQEISLEYYNGKGFKKLNCISGVETIFYQEGGGSGRIQFICPEDFSPFSVLGNEGLCIRMQILRADNCYLHPSIHHYPVIKDLEMSYSYEERYFEPDGIMRCAGSRQKNGMEPWARWKGRGYIPAFLPLPYDGTGLYLGFDKKPEGGPVSLFFMIDESRSVIPLSLRFEYSSFHGFKPLKVLDNTNGFIDSGTLIFMPPEDFARCNIEGRENYYIRILDMGNTGFKEESYYPVINHIYLNAVMVENIETMEEEEFYIDRVSAGMKFPLNAGNILNCQVYVNEINKYTPAQMKEMIADPMRKVKAEYNYLGEITEFYVLWEEVENFSRSKAGDRHYVIDRMNNTIEFGDGVHVKIPEYTAGAAFRVVAGCCRGAEGNVNPGSITRSASNLLFIGDIFNPVRGYGGSDIETPDMALNRGAALLSGRHRLISDRDYIREVKSFSGSIDQVKCVCGENGSISLVILMKDFEEGSYSFRNISRELKRHLLEQCELTVKPEDLNIREPVFLKISVEVWAVAEHMNEAFDIRNLLSERIRSFFHPVSTGPGTGHEIGVLPGEQQIITMLHSVPFNGRISRFTVTACYMDSDGEHETDISRMRQNPFIVCMNGNHTIHLSEA